MSYIGYKFLILIATGLIALSPLTPAAQSNEVNVYSYRQPSLIKPLFNQFTAETNIKVNVAFLQKGMVERLKAEGMRSPADLVMTVDISRLSQIVAEKVTQAVHSAVLLANIPANYRDINGHWFGLTARARIIYASKARVADGEISTYQDLVDKKWRGRICMRSGLHPYNLALISAMLAHVGADKTLEWLDRLKANLARKPQGNDRAQIKAIFNKQCDIAVGNTYYLAKMLADTKQRPWAESVRIIFPIFENGGTHINLSGIAMTRAAPNRANALKLMEFLSSTQAQEIYAEINAEYPLKPSTKPGQLVVASWGEFTADSIPLNKIARLRPLALKLVEKSGFNQ